MSVSSKWYVTKIEGQQVTLSPVCRGVENREWASATPAGSMTMWISNEAALEQFVLYEEYEFVATHRPKPSPGDGHAVQVVEQTYPGYPSKVYHLCGACGSYASLTEDGTPDWSKHDEVFGASR